MLKTNASQILIQKGRELFDAPKQFIRFTNNKEADELLNNLSHFPHAFVLACVMNRQIRAEKAFMIPFAISEKLGGFEFTKLSNLSLPQVKGLMTKPEPLHRFVEVMGRNFYEGIKLISDKYDGNAANIWSNKPSSAEFVYRFLEFHGVGPKIGTMAANILARQFKIPLEDYYSIDISVDVHVRRVFERLGLIEVGSSIERIVYRTRSLHPEFPGLLDFPAWEVGRNWCKPQSPNCVECYMSSACPSAKHVKR